MAKSTLQQRFEKLGLLLAAGAIVLWILGSAGKERHGERQ